MAEMDNADWRDALWAKTYSAKDIVKVLLSGMHTIVPGWTDLTHTTLHPTAPATEYEKIEGTSCNCLFVAELYPAIAPKFEA